MNRQRAAAENQASGVFAKLLPRRILYKVVVSGLSTQARHFGVSFVSLRSTSLNYNIASLGLSSLNHLPPLLLLVIDCRFYLNKDYNGMHACARMINLKLKGVIVGFLLVALATQVATHPRKIVGASHASKGDCWLRL